MKNLIKEFKEFISKGDVMSMAVGIIIGTSFTAIINALVDNVITPFIGIICGGADMFDLSFSVGNAQINVGLVLNAALRFLLTALVLFLVLKAVNNFNRQMEKLGKKMGLGEEEAPAEEPEPPVDETKELLKEIRDLLKEKK